MADDAGPRFFGGGIAAACCGNTAAAGEATERAGALVKLVAGAAVDLALAICAKNRATVPLGKGSLGAMLN